MFAINVRFQPLSAIKGYDEARIGLIKSLEGFDSKEIDYFGGIDKYDVLLKYLHSL